MKKYIITHRHEYGATTYVFESNSTLNGINENIYSVCEILGIDFEEDREELTVDEYPENIPTVIL